MTRKQCEHFENRHACKVINRISYIDTNKQIKICEARTYVQRMRKGDANSSTQLQIKIFNVKECCAVHIAQQCQRYSFAKSLLMSKERSSGGWRCKKRATISHSFHTEQHLNTEDGKNLWRLDTRKAWWTKRTKNYENNVTAVSPINMKPGRYPAST